MIDMAFLKLLISTTSSTSIDIFNFFSIWAMSFICATESQLKSPYFNLLKFIFFFNPKLEINILFINFLLIDIYYHFSFKIGSAGFPLTNIFLDNRLYNVDPALNFELFPNDAPVTTVE